MVINQQSASGRAQQAVQCRRRREEGRGPTPVEIRVQSPSRQLRSSSDSRTLCITYVKSETFARRSFSYDAPSVWNPLPREIRHIQSSTAFKTTLKTPWYLSSLTRQILFCKSANQKSTQSVCVESFTFGQISFPFIQRLSQNRFWLLFFKCLKIVSLKKKEKI